MPFDYWFFGCLFLITVTLLTIAFFKGRQEVKENEERLANMLAEDDAYDHGIIELKNKKLSTWEEE